MKQMDKELILTASIEIRKKPGIKTSAKYLKDLQDFDIIHLSTIIRGSYYAHTLVVEIPRLGVKYTSTFAEFSNPFNRAFTIERYL